MQEKFNQLLAMISNAPIEPHDKEELYELVYRSMVNTVMPVLFEHMSTDERAIFEDTMVRPTLSDVGDALGSAMKDPQTEHDVEESLGILFQDITGALEEQGIAH